MVEKTKIRILEPGITYLVFLECELRGNWISEEERIDLNGQDVNVDGTKQTIPQ